VSAATARDIHEWFLGRGLPLVLTRRVRSRRLIPRSAPVVSGIGAIIALTTLIADISDGHVDAGTVVRLGVMTAVLTTAPFALYLLHRAGTTRSETGRRSAALFVMALFVIGFPVVDRGWTGLTAAEVAGFGVIALLAIWLTYLGIGSIVLWAFRFAWVQFGALGTLMSRARANDSGRQSVSCPWWHWCSWW
jgi:hypothetical protein